MNRGNRLAPKRPVLTFFLLTFGISWSAWIPMAVIGSEVPILRVAGTFGPLSAALVLTVLGEGVAGLRKLLRGFLVWRVNILWYVVAFAATAVVVLAAIWIHVALGGTVPQFNDPAQLYLVIPIFAYVLFTSVLGEEAGWRGYALPRLQSTSGALPASLVIGFVWGIWHLPLFLIAGNFHREIPIVLFILQDVALSVVLTWLYFGAGGSLLLVHLFHAASNTTLGVLPILPQDTAGELRPLWIAVSLLCVVACVIVVATRGRLGAHVRSRAAQARREG